MHYIICLIWIRLAALKAESDSTVFQQKLKILLNF